MSQSRITQDEFKIRQGEIVKRIRKGWSHKKIIDWVQQTYDLSYGYSWKLVSDTYSELAEQSDKLIDSARVVSMERIEEILEDALTSGDRKNALKALDLINKLNGLYNHKQEVNITGEKITLKFD